MRVQIQKEPDNDAERIIYEELERCSVMHRKFRLIELALRGLRVEKAMDGLIDNLSPYALNSMIDDSKVTSEKPSQSRAETISEQIENAQDRESSQVETRMESVDNDTDSDDGIPEMTGIPII